MSETPVKTTYDVVLGGSNPGDLIAAYEKAKQLGCRFAFLDSEGKLRVTIAVGERVLIVSTASEKGEEG